ncbi:MAG: YkgJ family cysteine cluster protein [Candidatus Hydrogenedentota bacterium]
MLIKFKCKNCGECCRYYTAILTIYDIAKIMHNTGIRPSEFVEFYKEGATKDVSDDLYLVTEQGRYLIGFKKTEEGCIFLKDNKCSIHNYKPPICKLYPLDLRWNNDNILEYNVIKHSICKGDYGKEETDFGNIEELYYNYTIEYEYHKECLKNWKEYKEKLINPDEFIRWLENAINNGWPYYRTREVISQVIGGEEVGSEIEAR